MFAASSSALDLAEKKRPELIGLLDQLVSIRSQTGESAEVAQKLVSDYLNDLPYRIDQSKDRPSQYQNHPEYMSPNPPVMVLLSILWDGQSKPIGPLVQFSRILIRTLLRMVGLPILMNHFKNNRMYGLGTADDKGGVAAMLVAAKVLSEKGGPLPVVMSLHGKGGGSRGSLPIFERIKNSNNNIKAVLYAHPAETGRGFGGY